MPDYRLNFIDPDERVRRSLDLDCRDDTHAISVVREHLPAAAMELWQGERLVKRWEANDP